MAAHDAEYGRQAQPAAGELGGEKRIEDLLPGLLVHPRTRVGNFQVDVLSFREFFALLKFVFQPSEADVLLFKALYFPRQIFHRRIFYHGSSPCLQDSPSWVRIIIVEPSSVIPGTPGGYPAKVKALGSNLHV